ncbi:fatty acid desaturase family protein [Parafilimonas sp.]|uniref:fatty acid desaturase family protein n=1 Tax=Parafilimonas sp. TaxID=1969739 RepID=UPI0039E2240A
MTESVIKPSFIKNADAELFQQLRKEVNITVSRLEEKRRPGIIVKAILFPALYILSYLAALYWASNATIYYACFFSMGFLLVLNFLNLIHEAVHNTLFSSKRINNWYVHFFDLMGANSYIWKIRHIRLHHNYPNVMGWDSDFEQSQLARVFPHAPFSKMHQYQHIYLPLFYPLYLINWLLIRDFKDFFNKNKLVWKVIDHIPAIEYIKLFIFKIAFILYTILVPVLLFNVSWGQAIIAFLIMLFTASIVSLLVLLSPHASTESEYPMPDENGQMPMAWFRHQLSCTNDVSEDNWFIRFFMGCFNYHIAHHLFPAVNHVFYPEVTQIIRAFAAKNSLPYRQFPLFKSLRNHYRLLRTNAFHENIFEETM